MRTFFRIIGRCFAIAFGYLAAAFSAGIFYAYTLMPSQPGPETIERFLNISTELAIGIHVGLVLAATAIIPALIFISIAELMHWRSLVANLLGGGVIAGISIIMTLVGPEGATSAENLWIPVLAAGFIGGFIYWLIAGRSAGSWLPSRRADEALDFGRKNKDGMIVLGNDDDGDFDLGSGT